MKNINDIDLLMSDINEQINDSENIADKKGYQYIGWYDFLKTVRKKLEKEQYKFIFIGQKGIGKTTSILELFGLNNNMNGKKEDLLTTASGGTTTCEVELLKSNKHNTYFEIEPIDKGLYEQYIDDFCLMYEDENANDNSYLPTEIARSIRNMIGLKKKDIEEIHRDCKDHDVFKTEIERRINYANRTKTIVECEINNGSFYKDCQNIFNQINLCKLSDVMLPKKIKIYLTKDILDFDKIPLVGSIVDTRGIDTVFNSSSEVNKMKREDILDYIDNQQNDCLFFFIDGIKPAPSQSISELLRTRLSTGNEFRFYLIVNIHGQEAEEVMTDDGKAGEMQLGIDYKKDDIIDKFKQLNIKFQDQNILFFNARLNMPQNESILLSIKNDLANQRQNLFDLCNEIKIIYEKSKYDFENTQYALQNFEQLHKFIENVDTPNDVFDILLETFITELKNIHHSRIAAINRYEGEYYAFNFFHEISLIVENIFDDYFMKSREKIIDKVKEFIEYRNITELDKINYRVFMEKFESDYNNYRNNLKEFIKNEVKNRFSERSWEQAIDEYGRGPGYKNRVFEIYKNELNLFALNINVRDNYNSNWNSVIKENSLQK